jgi:hypothetical protein
MLVSFLRFTQFCVHNDEKGIEIVVVSKTEELLGRPKFR